VSYRFAIIGGGLTATSMICQLTDKLEVLQGEARSIISALSIDLFEKQDMVGPGTVHNDRFVLPFHVTNMCAGDMSVRADRPAEFQAWVLKNRESLAADFPELADMVTGTGSGDGMCQHYPRAIMGAYLKSQIEEASRTAEGIGLQLSIHAGCEADDLDVADRLIYLSIKNASGSRERTGPFDGVLLATGHWAKPAEHDRWVPSPWPADELLRKIPPGSRVGVLGSSLSAIEVALTLTSDGRFKRGSDGRLTYLPSDTPRKLTLYSRRGLLPRVRGRIGSRKNRFLSVERLRSKIADHPHRLRLAELFELLDQELSAAYGRRTDWDRLLNPKRQPAALLEEDLACSQSGDGPEGELVWQTVLVQIFPLVRALYLNLEPGERHRFDREFNTHFFLHAATQPAMNGEKLLALMEAGMVSVVRIGSDYRLDVDDAAGNFTIAFRGPGGNLRRDIFSYCVDARGQTRSVASDPSPLIRSLLKKGIVRLERTGAAISNTMDLKHGDVGGSILIDPRVHRVISPGDKQADGDWAAGGGIDLFAVGAMTRGQIIDSSMARGIARSTAAIADFLSTGP
jgi:uncharacterized NAD(P)/FAD-binding protein YdhS